MSGQMLRDSLANSVKELYSAEQQQARVLPKLVAAASSRSLRHALNQHAKQTAQQAVRLETVFALLEQSVRWARCPAVNGILEECEEAIEDHAAGAIRDAAIVATTQRLKYYEMASYGAAVAWAEALGLHEVASRLGQCLDEEVATADDLLAIGLTHVHPAAASASRAPSPPLSDHHVAGV